METIKRIAAINDISGASRCSLTVALPIISALGIQCCVMPTAILSNHTGYKDFFFEDYTNQMSEFSKNWQKMNVRFDCILENWIIKHPDDANKKVFSQPGQEESYTWERILVELRKQTPIGKMFEKLINQFYIYNLTSKSEQNAKDNNSIQQ